MKITVNGQIGQYEHTVKELLSRIQKGSNLHVEITQGEGGLSVSYQGETAYITYTQPCQLFRGVGYLLQWHEEGRNQANVTEQPTFEHLTYMVDCSRNAVCSFDYVRQLIRQMALMGYDRLMLYTEDAYEIKDYPFFGYLRGRYSQEELRALDEYAASFGIELVPCIQTLAHLNGIFHWREFDSVHDTADILCCDLDETYALIEAMVRTCAETFHSRMLNIGMDEAEMIGRGAYLRKFGYQERFDIMERHLKRVLAICEKYGFTCMMWSDMFFKMLSGGAYHTEGLEVSEEIRSRIPQNVELIYWDYYGRDKEKYGKMLEQHHALSDHIGFAGGAWKWNGFAPLMRHSMMASRLALESCAEHGIQNVLVTGWGDNGGEAAQSVVLPVLSLYAEYQHARRTDDAWIAPRLLACTGAVLEDFMELDTLNLTPDNPSPGRVSVGPAKYLLYQDVMMGIFDRHVDPDTYPAHYEACCRRLTEIAEKGGKYAYLFRTLAALADLLAVKCDLGIRIKNTYDAGDREELAQLAERCRMAAEKAARFHEEVRRQWMQENKVFGLEVLDIRIGGVKERLLRAAERLEALVSGETDVLEELEQERLLLDHRENPGFRTIPLWDNEWAKIATANTI